MNGVHLHQYWRGEREGESEKHLNTINSWAFNELENHKMIMNWSTPRKSQPRTHENDHYEYEHHYQGE